MSDYEYLNFGCKINDSKSLPQLWALKIILAKMKEDDETIPLSKALDCKMRGRRLHLPLELSDRLTDLTSSWYRLGDLRFCYQDLYQTSVTLEAETKRLGGKIERFHGNLVHFAQSKEPRCLAHTLIRIHECFWGMRNQDCEQEWPFFASVSTIWWFSDEPGLDESK